MLPLVRLWRRAVAFAAGPIGHPRGRAPIRKRDPKLILSELSELLGVWPPDVDGLALNKLRANLEGLDLEITLIPALGQDFRDRGRTRIEVSLPASVPEGFSVLPKILLTSAESPRSIPTGDRHFDPRYLVSGPELFCVAALRHEARRDFLALPDLMLKGGKLSLSLQDLQEDPTILKKTILRLIELVRSIAELTDNETTCARLLETVKSDSSSKARMVACTLVDRTHPSAERTPELLESMLDIVAHEREYFLRREALELLVDRFHDSEETKEALRLATKDGSPDTRLYAALRSPELRHAVLHDLAASGYVPTQIRLDALANFLDLGDAESANALLKLLGTDREKEIREKALDELSQRMEPEELYETMEWMIARAGMYAACTIAAFAVDRLEVERAQSLLIMLLSHKSELARIRTIDYLGKVGTVDAIEILHPLLARPGSIELKQAITDSIAAIRTRYPGRAAGSLALIEEGDQAGALTFNEERGTLTEPEEEAQPPSDDALSKVETLEGLD